MARGLSEQGFTVTRAENGNQALTLLGEHVFDVVVLHVKLNAVRHAVAGSEAHVGIKSGPDGVEICVLDEGEGIDAQHLPHVFDWFYQADAARSCGVGQRTGLGPSIVAAIIDVHRGTVHLEGTRRRATAVDMHLPRIDLQEQATISAFQTLQVRPRDLVIFSAAMRLMMRLILPRTADSEGALSQ